jgi:hypothetical protein
LIFSFLSFWFLINDFVQLRDTFSKALPYLDIYAMPESAVWLNAFISRVWCSLYNRCSTTLRAIAAYQQAKRCVSSTDINVSLDDEEELKRLKELVDQSWFVYRSISVFG